MHILALFGRHSTEKCLPGKALKFQAPNEGLHLSHLQDKSRKQRNAK